MAENNNYMGFQQVEENQVGGFEDRELGWDDEIERESEFVLLPEGEYKFEVIDFERARHPGSEKLPPCNKAIVHMKIYGNNGQNTTIKYNLFLHTKTEGMLTAFFTGIGLRKHGERLRMNWNAIIGRTGRCKLGIRQYNGNQYNEIKRILEPSNDAPQQQAQASFTGGTF